MDSENTKTDMTTAALTAQRERWWYEEKLLLCRRAEQHNLELEARASRSSTPELGRPQAA